MPTVSFKDALHRRVKAYKKETKLCCATFALVLLTSLFKLFSCAVNNENIIDMHIQDISVPKKEMNGNNRKTEIDIVQVLK